MSTPHRMLADAFALHEAGRLEAAEQAYHRFLAANRDHAEALHRLGAVSMQLGKLDAARAHFAAVVRLRPDHALAHSQLAEIEHKTGGRDAAIASWREAVRLRPDLRPAVQNLGAALIESGRLDEAAECLARLTGLDPRSAVAWHDLGCVHDRRGDFAAARAAFSRAVELDPSRAEARADLGNVLFFLGEHAAALAHLDRAVASAPERAAIRVRRGLGRLALGDYEGGLEDYEHRTRLPVHRRQGLPGAPWRGEDLTGRTILLHAEQRAGDVIQLVRYAPHVAARGADVVVECHGSLVELIARSGLAGRVVARGSALPRCDYHVGLASLPHHFRTRLATIPGRVPYLQAPRSMSPELAAALGGEAGRPRIGLVWAGDPNHPRDRQRSCPPALFGRIVAGVEARCFGLQKGPQELALGPADGVTPLGPMLADFATTAAVVARLDLVITVDTSVAHLAGALGKPVLVLLGLPEDWRWLRGRDDSPWYPTARLVRQRSPGDWDGVGALARAALLEHLERLASVEQTATAEPSRC